MSRFCFSSLSLCPAPWGVDSSPPSSCLASLPLQGPGAPSTRPACRSAGRCCRQLVDSPGLCPGQVFHCNAPCRLTREERFFELTSAKDLTPITLVFSPD